MKTKILGDFQICISVPLNLVYERVKNVEKHYFYQTKYIGGEKYDISND